MPTASPSLAGVPDSALKSFCDYINGTGKNEFEHYVPVNEGAAVGIAIGSYLATGVPAFVYMQNQAPRLMFLFLFFLFAQQNLLLTCLIPRIQLAQFLQCINFYYTFR